MWDDKNIFARSIKALIIISQVKQKPAFGLLLNLNPQNIWLRYWVLYLPPPPLLLFFGGAQQGFKNWLKYVFSSNKPFHLDLEHVILITA